MKMLSKVFYYSILYFHKAGSIANGKYFKVPLSSPAGSCMGHGIWDMGYEYNKIGNKSARIL